MKILNGNRYFDKDDVSELKKKSIYFVSNNPSNEYDFIYSLEKDELNTLIEGITAMNNTIMWEFLQETAINMTKIEKCYKTLRVYRTNKISFDEFRNIPAEQVTSYCVTKYENWLKNIGQDIFLNFFVEYKI